MKILVLMPCDEKMIPVAEKIYSELPKEVKDKTFMMPMFMDYLMTTKIVGNWVVAFYDSLISMKNIYKAAAKGKQDLIVFGTAPRNMKFDAIFSFQDAELQLPYEDKFLQKIKELVVEDAHLTSLVSNMYEASDSRFNLFDCGATAGFLTDYLQTDPKLDEIKEKYKDKLKFKEVESDGERV